MTKYILLGLFGVVASLGLALGLLVGTEAGSRWALGKVPGLEVTDFQGRLAGSWQASRLRWADGGSTACGFDHKASGYSG